MLQLRHYITWPDVSGYYFNGKCQFLWNVFPSELATVQLCTTSWIHKVAGKWTDRLWTDSLTPGMAGKWLNLNYLIEPLVGSGNYSLWMKLLLYKLREELATALNTIFVPIISMSYFNLQWKIHKVVAHWVRLSLVHSLFPVTARINF